SCHCESPRRRRPRGSLFAWPFAPSVCGAMDRTSSLRWTPFFAGYGDAVRPELLPGDSRAKALERSAGSLGSPFLPGSGFSKKSHEVPVMSITDLENTAKALVADGKGILAADETPQTLTKRFEALKINSTPDSRRDYREMLFTTPYVAEF